jgi:transcriptional regulator
MYVPARFRESDTAVLRAFLREHSFATLVTMDALRPIATHLPLVVRDLDDGAVALLGHMSRENPQWKTFDPHAEALVIFQGPHTYISAGWYKAAGVPTWNYMSVHAYGVPGLLDAPELHALLDELVQFHESRSNAGSRYSLSGLPKAYVEGMMKGIVGFSIAVTRLEASFKLSQNADANDHENVIRELRRRGDADSVRIADAMARKRT